MKTVLFACALLTAAAVAPRLRADDCARPTTTPWADMVPTAPAATAPPAAVLMARAVTDMPSLALCGVVHHPPKHGNRAAAYRSTLSPWHGGYYYTQSGTPVALVIPPNAEMHTDYSWGVPSSRVSWNNHQFQRPFPGYGYGGGYGFLPTPQYPSDTDQFGVYYVRGPW